MILIQARFMRPLGLHPDFLYERRTIILEKKKKMSLRREQRRRIIMRYALGIIRHARSLPFGVSMAIRTADLDKTTQQNASRRHRPV